MGCAHVTLNLESLKTVSIGASALQFDPAHETRSMRCYSITNRCALEKWSPFITESVVVLRSSS